MGGAALHFGWIAEMKTGEGKTLVSTLPVYLNALDSKGVHVVTVNDYLAAVTPSGWARSTSSSASPWAASRPSCPTGRTRRTHTTATSRTAPTPSSASTTCVTTWRRSLEHMVQRGHAYAIVDEVDSILIDEARTPLIISGPSSESARLYYQFAGVARSLTRDTDYEVDEEKRTIAPTEEGIEKVESAARVSTTSTTSARPT